MTFSWLSKFSKNTLTVVLLIAEVLLGLAEKTFFDDWKDWQFTSGYFFCCLLSIACLRLLHDNQLLLRTRVYSGDENLWSWDKVIQKFASMNEFSQNVRRALRDYAIPVPPQFASVVTDSLFTEVERMNRLTAEGPVFEVNLNTQFNVYARAIAQHHTTHPVDTIYATFLDPPAITEYNQEYFDMQVTLRATTNTFGEFAKHERNSLREFLEQHKPDRLGRHSGPPTKARLVVIEKDKLQEELGNDSFWYFLNWHVRNYVGLKFFLNPPEKSGSLSRAHEEDSFAKLLRTRVQRQPIEDFIVYGEKCVFGRIQAKPENGLVTLGFYYAERGPQSGVLIRSYKSCFENLWKDKADGFADTHSLTELWGRNPDLVDCFTKHSDKLRTHLAEYTRACDNLGAQ
jgi:hypothetical protein